MRYYIVDIETIPLPEEDLVKLMPPNIAATEMPEEIKNPVMPAEIASEEWIAWQPTDDEILMKDCPAYVSKKHPEGDPEKRAAYRAKQIEAGQMRDKAAKEKYFEKRAAWQAKADAQRLEWDEKQIERKQRFIDDAALSPVTGSVKLVGIRDWQKGITHIFVASVTEPEKAKLEGATYPSKVVFHYNTTEMMLLANVANLINSGRIVPGDLGNGLDPFRLVGFYTHGFDWPFLARRSWINQCAWAYTMRKGRYWNDACSLDLLEAWQLGDRQEKVGGMDGLAKILGTKRKSDNGEGFHRLWEADPVAAVLYLINDIDVAEEIASAMGVFPIPPEES